MAHAWPAQAVAWHTPLNWVFQDVILYSWILRYKVLRLIPKTLAAWDLFPLDVTKACLMFWTLGLPALWKEVETALQPVTNSGGSSSMVITFRLQRINACSNVFLSSLTFPGQLYLMKKFRTSDDTSSTLFPNFLLKICLSHILKGWWKPTKKSKGSNMKMLY